MKEFRYFLRFLEDVSKTYSKMVIKNGWKDRKSFSLEIYHKSVQNTNMNKIFRRNCNLSQKLKPIIIEWTSYCIQFEIGDETVKILKFKKSPSLVSKFS